MVKQQLKVIIKNALLCIIVIVFVVQIGRVAV